MCGAGTVESSTTNRGQILINGFDLLRKGLFCAVLFFWCCSFHFMKEIWVYVCTRNPSTTPLPPLSISEPPLPPAIRPHWIAWLPSPPPFLGSTPPITLRSSALPLIFVRCALKHFRDIGIFGWIPNMWWMIFCCIFSWWYLVGSQICRRYFVHGFSYLLCAALKVGDIWCDTVESTRIEPFLGENRVILD